MASIWASVGPGGVGGAGVGLKGEGVNAFFLGVMGALPLLMVSRIVFKAIPPPITPTSGGQQATGDHRQGRHDRAGLAGAGGGSSRIGIGVWIRVGIAGGIIGRIGLGRNVSCHVHIFRVEHVVRAGVLQLDPQWFSIPDDRGSFDTIDAPEHLDGRDRLTIRPDIGC